MLHFKQFYAVIFLPVVHNPVQVLSNGVPARLMSRYRQWLDQRVGGVQWHPNIQHGAPLTQRVVSLLNGLQQQGFSLWTQSTKLDSKLVLECFPAEAIWAMKRLGQYPEALLASDVKAYKSSKVIILRIR